MNTGLDEDKLSRHGYSRYSSYVMGLNSNKTLISWEGHGQENKLNPGKKYIIICFKSVSLFIQVSYNNKKT